MYTFTQMIYKFNNLADEIFMIQRVIRGKIHYSEFERIVK